MKNLKLIFVTAAMTTICVAPTALAQSPSAERPHILPLLFEENWRPLTNPELRTEPLDGLKYVPLSTEGDKWLTLGGEQRFRFENYAPLALGFGGAGDDAYLLSRTYLHADLHLDPSFRAFVQLSYHDVLGERGRFPPIQDNEVDVAQAFVDLSAPIAEGRGTLRVGRQELLFGSGRFVGPRDGPNLRLAFDGVRASYARADTLKLDAFYLRPVLPRPGAFDDRSSETYEFWGAYATLPRIGPPGLGLDLYYMGLDRSSVSFAEGVGEETRHTLGARLFGRADGWDWDLEAAYQFGDFRDQDIGAWTVATDVGYTFVNAPWSPRLGLRANVASGDGRAGDGRLGTFEVPFPKLPYITEAALVSPANIIDVHPSLTLQARRDLTLGFDYVALWRHRTGDAYYLPPLTPVPGTTGGGRFIGHQLAANLTWRPTPNLGIQSSYVRQFTSNSLQRAGASDVDFIMASAA